MSWRPRPRSWDWATEVNRFTVLYDACILYPAPLRDLLMRLALTDLYRARWTKRTPAASCLEGTRQRSGQDGLRLGPPGDALLAHSRGRQVQAGSLSASPTPASGATTPSGPGSCACSRRSAPTSALRNLPIALWPGLRTSLTKPWLPLRRKRSAAWDGATTGR